MGQHSVPSFYLETHRWTLPACTVEPWRDTLRGNMKQKDEMMAVDYYTGILLSRRKTVKEIDSPWLNLVRKVRAKF